MTAPGPRSLKGHGLVLLLLGTLLAMLPVIATRAPADAATNGIRRATLTFRVTNTNATALPCRADGASYVLRARLVMPTNEPARGEVLRANLLVHDFTAGRWFWSLPGHPGYNYAAALARAGETTIAIDRLGYDGSPLADGTATCLGAQATMLHQVVQRLRSGRYRSTGARPTFGHVVVHGHSVGAGIAELEAGTFRDVAGLVVMSWSDSGPTERAITESASQHRVCTSGADYAYYGQSARAFRELLFVSAPASVRAEATRRRNPDPCGDALGLAQLVVVNHAVNRRIDVPVLLLFGARDALVRAEGRDQQALAYSPSANVTMRVLAGTGSALPLEASAPTTRRIVTRWLCGTFACGTWF